VTRNALVICIIAAAATSIGNPTAVYSAPAKKPIVNPAQKTKKTPGSSSPAALQQYQKNIFALIAAGNYKEAEPQLRLALKSFPTDRKLIFARAQIASYNCDFKNAVKDFTTVLGANPQDPSTLAQRADAYVQLEEYDRARIDYNDATVLTRQGMYSEQLSYIDDLEYDAAHKEKDPAKRWALGCSALLFMENKLGSKSLLGGLPERVVSQKRSLKSWWGVDDRTSLLAILKYQVREGHNFKWHEMCRAANSGMLTAAPAAGWQSQSDMDTKVELVKKYGTAFGERGLSAWDLSRYICLCRWGYQCGYITEDEAWQLIMPVAAKIQATCKGWNYLGTEYLIGRRFWSNSQYLKSEKSYSWLKHRLLHSPDSTWVQFAWNIPLNCQGDNATIYRAIDRVAAR
jgi:tetratricopeptide (TPR) repeat protein